MRASVLKAAFLLVAAAGALPAAGCAADWDPFNRLNSLRVLAIRNEPVAPASGETTTFSALVYTPSGQDPATLEYSWR